MLGKHLSGKRRNVVKFVAFGAVFAVILGACSGAAAPASTNGAVAAPSAAKSSEWDLIVAAAVKEGSVNIQGPGPLNVYGPMLAKFEQAYPGIKVTSVAGGSPYFPKLDAERKAGQFNWDVSVNSCGGVMRVLIDAKTVDSLLPLVLPEVASDANWVGGFKKGFLDNGGQYCYSFEGSRSPAIWVNRKFIPERELNDVDQVLDPKFKGKLAIEDPRTGSTIAAGHLAPFLKNKGEAWVTKLIEQRGAITADRRQLADWLVRGTYPIAIGLTTVELQPFKEQGLTNDLGDVDQKNSNGSISAAWGGLAVFNQAPHPNAARVFINWILGKDAQAGWVAVCGGCNSRRSDVAPGDKATVPVAADELRDTQAMQQFNFQINALAKKLIP